MKRLVSVILVLILVCSGLCACGGSAEFTIICNDGTVETMSIDDLEHLYENELLYQQKYAGAHVSGKGEIYAIDADGWKSDGTINTVSVQIESFTTEVCYVPAEYAAAYKVGDEFEVSGKLRSSMNGFARIEADDFYY